MESENLRFVSLLLHARCFGVATVDNKEYLFRAGECFISFPNQIHYYHDVIPIRGFMIVFLPELFGDYVDLFRKKTPLFPLVNKLRVEHASRLLKKGMRVTDAAYESGFSSVRTFNRAFQKYMMMSPREYNKISKINTKNLNLNIAYYYNVNYNQIKGDGNMNTHILDLTDRLVSISDFSQGKAGKIFSDVAKNDKEYIVLKNNQPTAVVISIKEYKDTQEKIAKFEKLLEKMEEVRLMRLAENRTYSETSSFVEFVEEQGFSIEELEALEEDVEIE